jgi:hypothetical protein
VGSSSEKKAARSAAAEPEAFDAKHGQAVDSGERNFAL